MIQPLRIVHRRVFAALAFVLPTILIVGLGLRHPRPGPSANATQVPATAYLVRESSGLWQKNTIQSKFYSKSYRVQDIYVVLQPAQELSEPDLLLYWTANAPQGSSLPREAQLLGGFTTGKAFFLPLDEKRAGHLVLFSLAHQVVFDIATVEKVP
jgi:hypothetical protein